MGLPNLLQNDATRISLIHACADLIDTQVSSKGGLGGMALKAAYGVVKGIGPDYVPGAVERLLPSVLTALDPLWSEGVSTGDPAAYLQEQSTRTADSLLSVTDARIANSSNGLIKTTYQRLRQSVKGDVEAAVPGLAKILATHAVQALPQ
ncbi:hypothetical protein GFS31_11140 [Leptolyngbya sp. BL0902]|uniref:DUF6918 family protein n=1 Tax=Leptolyngbya sp. BL0902 TaxID=1115757 RepID=UPI0018E772B2|nr:DUF2379 family protein [Leptolyngbya sp. BL0902]QQE64433.1 hypothetical protein GFS31_11140 [Leptolyngbya sp. BL0902]